MKQVKRIVGLIISLILIVLFCHPGWLPLPEKTAGTMQSLFDGHFLLRGDAGITVAHVLMLIPAMLIIWVVCTLLSMLLEVIGKAKSRSATVTNLLQSIVKYFSVIIALLWGFSILGVNTGAVLASIGIIGLIVGFGAQSLIEDIITGFFIIFEGEYGVGDIIILDDFRGTVRSIGVRTTVIEDAGGNLKVVNNSDIRNFQNRSRNNSVALCLVSVAYSTDLRKLEALLKEALPKLKEEHPDLYLTAPRYLGVDALADSGVNLKFAVDVTEQNVFGAQRMLARDLKILFDEKGVEIPFPQVVVHQADK